jgi:hypothetical protein
MCVDVIYRSVFWHFMTELFLISKMVCFSPKFLLPSISNSSLSAKNLAILFSVLLKLILLLLLSLLLLL